MPNESLEFCLKSARDRLYPSLFSPNYLVLRKRRELFSGWLRDMPGQDWRVLDVGGRYQPYRPLVESRTKTYIALDVQCTPLVTAIGSGQDLPFADSSFDLVIATQVFEYFPQPHLAAAEIHRVLKPGGCLLMSVASLVPRFVDEECWRYLPSGLRSVLASFSEIEIVPEMKTVGTLFRTASLSLSIVVRYSWLRQIVHHSVVPLLNLVGWQMDGLMRRRNDQFVANYSVLARKAKSGAPARP